MAGKKIIYLKDGERNLEITGRVIDVSEPKEVQTKRGETTLREITIGDDTGRVPVTLWGDNVSVKKGSVIKISNAWTTSYKGKVKLNAGDKSKITEVKDDGFPTEDEIPEKSPSAFSKSNYKNNNYSKTGYNKTKNWKKKSYEEDYDEFE